MTPPTIPPGPLARCHFQEREKNVGDALSADLFDQFCPGYLTVSNSGSIRDLRARLAGVLFHLVPELAEDAS